MKAYKRAVRKADWREEEQDRTSRSNQGRGAQKGGKRGGKGRGMLREGSQNEEEVSVDRVGWRK